MKYLTKLPKLVYLFVGVVIGTVLLSLGFLFGKQSVMPLLIPKPVVVYEATPSATPVAYEDERKLCDDGYKLFEGDSFILCYPDDLARVTEATASSIRFVSESEELRVEPKSDEKWPLHLCNVEQKTEVGGYSAVRTIFKEPLSVGCGKTTGYATKVNKGGGVIFFLGFYKTKGSFDGPSGFESIEQSLMFDR